MPAADGDRLAYYVSVTYRGVTSDQARELIRQLEGLSLGESPSPSLGPNPYVVVDPPAQVPAPATQRRNEVLYDPWTCHGCGGSTRTAPGEGVFCRNTACPRSRLHVIPTPVRELVVSPGTTAGIPLAEPSPESPAITWGPVCRALKKGRQSAAFDERCTQLRAHEEPFCARWHVGWTGRGRGCRSIDDLTAGEREQCAFTFH